MPKVHKDKKDLYDGISNRPFNPRSNSSSLNSVLSKLEVAVVLTGGGVFTNKVLSLIMRSHDYLQ